MLVVEASFNSLAEFICQEWIMFQLSKPDLTEIGFKSKRELETKTCFYYQNRF